MVFHYINSLDIVTFVEWATVIVTFIMMASGFPACLNMYRKKSTTNVPYMLFLISALVSTFSLQYGILIKRNVLIFINGVAVLVWGAYVSVYILVSRSKAVPVLKLLAVVGLYSAHVVYLRTLPASSVGTTLGNYLIVWCTIAYVIPGVDIITMVKQKSTHCCDIPLLFGGTLTAAVWYWYGALVDDVNIYFPSIPALLISAIKFSLMFLYGTPSAHHHGYKVPHKDEIGDHFHDSVYNNARSRENVRKRKD